MCVTAEPDFKLLQEAIWTGKWKLWQHNVTTVAESRQNCGTRAEVSLATASLAIFLCGFSKKKKKRNFHQSLLTFLTAKRVGSWLANAAAAAASRRHILLVGGRRFELCNQLPGCLVMCIWFEKAAAAAASFRSGDGQMLFLRRGGAIKAALKRLKEPKCNCKKNPPPKKRPCLAGVVRKNPLTCQVTSAKPSRTDWLWWSWTGSRPATCQSPDGEDTDC